MSIISGNREIQEDGENIVCIFEPIAFICFKASVLYVCGLC